MNRTDLKSMTLDEMKTAFAGQPSFRALQIYNWLHKGVSDFEEMTNLPKKLRDQLAAEYYIAAARIERKYCSELDDTVKYLFRLNDGEMVEGVLMSYHHGRTVCISTQVGCKMNCAFCATGKSGFSRNLTASEILSQVQTAQMDAGERISNIVLMGMGEPLDNYEAVLRFLDLVSSKEGMNIGMRHISLSTCGIVDKIYDLAEKKYQLTLSVSLHAPNDQIRSRIMPVNNRWNLNELLRACRTYIELTGRRISFEYAMIEGVNDSPENAEELARRLRGVLCHVNLIPVNHVGGSVFHKSSSERLRAFESTLLNHGITATVRRTLGADIQASCGQLKRRFKEEVANVEDFQ
ncbi:23S rRNA (adenine(2503)-C(2))-methyltransferase RlmN [Caproicibacter sp.]|uniref:23S rRNA (adenine(2503)-C(2))-methyltransferase RlmN n=1 Tax=Caproicibacter sp. TaxID=2814884 RepID=UPI0039896FFF